MSKKVFKIFLTQGLSTLVDEDIYLKYGNLNWFAAKHYSTFYVQRKIRLENGKQTTLSLHRLITNCPAGLAVDHKDGNGLNNLRSNLEIVTPRKNQQNRKQHRLGRLLGATWHKQRNKWEAQIKIGKKKIYLGLFDTELEAHNAYLKAVEGK